MIENNNLDLGPRRAGATKLAQKLLKDVGVSMPPVSLQKVIEHLKNTNNLEVVKISTSEHLSGLIAVCEELDQQYATIGYNQNDPWYRRRFTIAHEIGHMLFGHTCNGGLHNEREANLFAGELLVPKPMLKVEFSKTPDIDKLSRLFRVSKEALLRKVMSDKLI